MCKWKSVLSKLNLEAGLNSVMTDKSSATNKQDAIKMFTRKLPGCFVDLNGI